MTAVLRVMLDQLVAPTDNDLKVASGELVRALIAHAPQGCEVEGIAPAAGGDGVAALSIPGMAGVRRTSLPRRELAGALQLGVATGIGGGMIHAPSLFAPLVKHDRVHNNDQTSVTVWDLRPWDAPDELSRSSVAWHKAMLKRARYGYFRATMPWPMSRSLSQPVWFIGWEAHGLISSWPLRLRFCSSIRLSKLSAMRAAI